MWRQLAILVGAFAVLVVAMQRLYLVIARIDPRARFDSDIDVGTVSERWLAEQRGSGKD